MRKLTWKILKQRLTQKLLHKPLNIRQSWEETPAEFTDDMYAFQNWFDTASSLENCILRAKNDWQYRFKSFKFFKEINHDAALEIGFGGGRLLAQAAKDFAYVYGVDIHQSFAMTQQFLQQQHVNNFTLVHRDQLSQLKDHSIDFVYSFIVFQHFDSIAEVNYYLDHINRLLKADGIAHIYYGKNKKEAIRETSAQNFELRDCSLFISPKIMKDIIKQKFELLLQEECLPKNLIDNSGESGQAMVIFKRRS
ncbi:MAG: hypothetical protein Tsb005_05050 [Gammaproteobacteria bacterium]